ncbi:thymidylate kinase [Candidatus Woesearchaeota archaeon]|nr:thymidylate kinase [Candidatus Woesearchaeota archaeon]
MTKNKFVMVDGLDGSGKGTIVDALQKWAELKAMKVLDLRSYCRENGTFPEPEEVMQYDAVVSAEPTFCLVGKAIREELVRATGRHYSAMSLAQAFALDREILYKRVLIPAIKAGKYVFQERGISSSLVYQPVQEHIQLSELIRLAGNKTALQFAPGLFIVATVKPETVMGRLGARPKKDYSIFDSLEFQRNLDSRFRSDWLRQLLEQHGSKVIYLSTDEPKTVDETQKEAVKAFEDFLAQK